MGLGVAQSGNRRARTLVSKRDGSQHYRLPGDREIEVVLPASNIPDRTLQRMACDLSRDGLEREFKFFNWLVDGVCKTCALRSPRKI